MPTHRFHSRALTAVLTVITAVVFAGCSADQMTSFQEALADAPAGAAIDASGPLSHAQLARLRTCESGGDYTAVSRSGAFRGAYQFNRTTWNGVAARHFSGYVGVDPAHAPPVVQDAMTQRLWGERGRAPWPVCGRRV